MADGDNKTFCGAASCRRYGGKIAALPYDVYNRKEAKEAVKDAPHSFLRIDRAETTLPDDVDTYDERVYKRAKELLTEQVEKGEYITEDKPCFYLYELVMNGRSQTGVVGCASIDDYCSNVIKSMKIPVRIKRKTVSAMWIP